MELVANVWPVVDSSTGVVLRFMVRAYAMDGPDATISATLRALAPTDFRMATVFRIPERFTINSEHGQLSGCVMIGTFHQHQPELLEPAFRRLEESFVRLQGVAARPESSDVYGVALIPRFPPEPYLLVTSLVEMPDGRLIPQAAP